MPQPTSISFLGVCKEVTKGVWLTPTDYIPVSSFEPVDVIMPLEDNAYRGSMVDLYGWTQGPKYVTYKAAGPVFNDSIGYLLGAFFGDCTTTGAGAPFTHAFSTKNSGDGQPLAYSFTDFYAAGTRGYSGLQCHDLSFKFSGDGMLTYEAMLTGLLEATQTKPTATFGTRPIIPVWQVGEGDRLFGEDIVIGPATPRQSAEAGTVWVFGAVTFTAIDALVNT